MLHILPDTQPHAPTANLTLWKAHEPNWTAYIFYPFALAGTLVFIAAEVHGALGPLGKAYPIYLLVVIATMLTYERLAPMRPDWGMSQHTFLRRDLPMIIINGATIAATTSTVTWLAQRSVVLPLHTVALHWALEAALAVLVSDFLWYWVHRYSHEGKGRLGQRLWKTHAIHHLPSEVYVLMHAAGHPINSAYVRIILMLPAIVLGLSPEGVFAASVLTGFQGLVSHFNVDSRAGWLNRVFVGTELHRFHHSACPGEAKNYAATVSIWDQFFGTYSLPGAAPDKLGMSDRLNYPADGQWAKLLALPFK
ncbi:MAG: sterol desaturase family protein [Hylemonella sp.]|nr:sterol desaturase family protein [Hylemonella sp.]